MNTRFAKAAEFDIIKNNGYLELERNENNG